MFFGRIPILHFMCVMSTDISEKVKPRDKVKEEQVVRYYKYCALCTKVKLSEMR
jgi:hypothetical protein